MEIVGESGSGKSVTALALMRLLDAASSEVSSEGLWLRRRNRQVIALNEQSEAEMRRVCGADQAMIFQEPMTSLNPVFTIGEQIAESLRLHQGLGRDEALRAAKKMLDQVRIPQAEEMLSRYPHQLSGGMRKRVALAQTLIVDPKIILMDEPFSALDVQTRQMMENELLDLWAADRKSVVFITHDLEEAIAMSDRVLVLSAGPGSRLIGEYRIDLDRPRDVAEIRMTPQFLALHQEIWAQLRDEVLKGYAQTKLR